MKKIIMLVVLATIGSAHCDVANTPLMNAVFACYNAQHGKGSQTLQQAFGSFGYVLSHSNIAQINTPSGSSSMTPLMMAAHFGLVNIVRALLRAGASTSPTDINGKNAAWYAQHDISNNKDSRAQVQTLISNPTSCKDNTPLLLAVIDYINNGQTTTAFQKIRIILHNYPEQINAPSGEWAATPLMYAVAHGLPDLTEELLTAGASKYSISAGGLNSVYFATQQCVPTGPNASCAKVQALLAN